MQDVIISCILNNVELVLVRRITTFHLFLLALIPIEALLANIKVSYSLALEVSMPSCDILITGITVYNILPIHIVFTKLVAKWEPTLTQVVISSEKLYLFSSWH